MMSASGSFDFSAAAGDSNSGAAPRWTIAEESSHAQFSTSERSAVRSSADKMAGEPRRLASLPPRPSARKRFVRPEQPEWCAPDKLASAAFSSAGRAYSGPASVCGSSGWHARHPLRRTVRVDFARRDQSGKIARPAGPEGRNSAGPGGAMQGIADWARPARVRLRICGERHRRLGPSSLPIRTSRTSASCSGTAAKSWRPSLNSPESRSQRPSLFLRWWRQGTPTRPNLRSPMQRCKVWRRLLRAVTGAMGPGAEDRGSHRQDSARCDARRLF
jgi:hypothetical protein